MANIIFSIWRDFDRKPENIWIQKKYRKWKPTLEEKQKEYAYRCRANYRMYVVDKITDFATIQFMKILIAEQLTNEYDKVLYLDLDVLPQTDINFFEYHDKNFDKVLCHRTLSPRWKIYQKKLMLSLSGVSSSPHNICNTGVLGLSKKSAESLNFSLNEKLVDKEFPEMEPNNEIWLSYLIEKNKVPFHDIGIGWNFIVDNNYKAVTAGCHFLHMSNLMFDPVLQSLYPNVKHP